MEYSNFEILQVISWFGAVALVLAGLFIDQVKGKLLQLAGIGCLLLQSIYLQEMNLVFLNVASGIAFSISLYRQLSTPVIKSSSQVFCDRRQS